MSKALEALYAGDSRRAGTLLGPDDELSVFEATAFGRVERLRAILERDGSQAGARGEDGFTALHLAIFGGSREAVQLLIDNGADVDALSTGSIARVRPLGTAAFVRSAPLAALLLDAGADVNGRSEGGFTALHSAAQSGDEELTRLLLERGADPALTTDDGTTPADLAEAAGVRRLLGDEGAG